MKRRVWDWSQVKPPSLPIRDWLPHYERRWLRPDLIAAAAVWAVLVPEGMAYASLAGMPPETGLFAALAAAAGVRRPRHLPAADGRPELGDRRLLGGRRGAAGGRRPRPLHRPVGAARPPRRRAASGRRPRPRRLHRRLLRPPGADRLRRRTGARHRRGAAAQAVRRRGRRHQLLRQARGAAAAARLHQPGHAGHRARGPGASSSRCGPSRPRCRRRWSPSCWGSSPSPSSASRTTASPSSARSPTACPAPPSRASASATSPTCCPTPRRSR